MKTTFKMTATISFALLFFFPSLSFATVGGPQEIEILGYETKEQKIYVLKHFYDARGRLPQLYYYQLNAKNPQQLIEVKSIYLHPISKKIDYDQEPTHFNQQLKQIKNRLQKLTPLLAQDLELQILSAQAKKPSSQQNFIQKVSYHYQYRVAWNQQMSLLTTATSYHPHLKIRQAFQIPKQNMSIAIVRYLGIPFETGYHQEETVLLTTQKSLH